MNKKLFILIIIGMFLVFPVVSANKLTYANGANGNPDLKVTLSDTTLFGLIKTKELGTLELKSHKSINEIKKVGLGNQVTMYYDFNFQELYKNGLGNVEFTDMRTGKLVDREYKFVYWGDESYEVPVYSYKLVETSNGTINQSTQIGTKTKTRKVWLDYNSKNIPKGKIRIGIMVNNKQGDFIDGVWEIGDKKVKKHAEWTANLNTDLVSYYKLDESSGTTAYDSLGTNNGTNYGATPGVTSNPSGNLGTAYDFDGTNDYVDLGNWNFNGGVSVCGWVKFDVNTVTVISNDISNINPRGMQFLGYTDADKFTFYDGNNPLDTTETYSTGTWYFVCNTHDGSTQKIYVNGSLKATASSTINNVNKQLILGGRNTATINFNGILDEVGIWSRALTSSEVTQLYNNGNGLGYLQKGLDIYLNSPEDNFKSNNTQVTFNASVITPRSDLQIENVSLYLNGVLNETNSSHFNGTYIFNKNFTDGNYNWSILAWDNESTNYTSDTRDFSVDTIPPTISITSPTGTFNYLYPEYNLSLNWTVNDTNLDTCWYNYNNTNTTVTCADNQTYFNYTKDVNILTFYANDTFGHLTSDTTSWDYKVFENSRTFSPITYQTKSESYTIDLTSNGLTSVVLDINGTQYPTTNTGNEWTTATFDIPKDNLGNYTLKWIFTAGDTFNSTNSYQDVQETVFTICHASYTNKFLNISFKDEALLTPINESITLGTFEYYLGSGTQTKSYTYTNTANNYYYEFCATPDETFKVDPYVQYKQGTDYPQRIWDIGLTSYTSTITNQVLYSLSSIDGIYVTFHLITPTEQPISGVEVIGTRTIEGEEVDVAHGTTNSAGVVTFWLNPDFVHDFSFTKTGYDIYETSLSPTQTDYTVTLGGSSTTEPDYSQGIIYSIKPSDSFILNNQLYNFNFTISSEYSSLEKFGFDLSYLNGTEIGSVFSTTGTGGIINLDATTGDSGGIRMNYYYLINDTYTNGTSKWYVYKANSFSINHFFKRVVTYIDLDIFGVQSDDEGFFFKAILSVFVLITVTGILSSRYGIASEQAISGIIFGILLFLNTIHLIPNPPGTSITHFGDFLVTIVGLIIIISIFKEERR